MCKPSDDIDLEFSPNFINKRTKTIKEVDTDLYSKTLCNPFNRLYFIYMIYFILYINTMIYEPPNVHTTIFLLLLLI